MTFRSRFARLVGLEVGDKTTGEAVGTEVGVRVGLGEIGAVDVGLLVIGDALGLLLGVEVTGGRVIISHSRNSS